MGSKERTPPLPRKLGPSELHVTIVGGRSEGSDGKAFIEKVLKSAEEAACPACALPYSKHSGINDTCKQLQGSIELVEKLKEVTKDLVSSNTALRELMEYAATARKRNTTQWMRGFEEELNKTLRIIGDEDRVELKGDCIVVCRQRPGASDV